MKCSRRLNSAYPRSIRFAQLAALETRWLTGVAVACAVGALFCLPAVSAQAQQSTSATHQSAPAARPAAASQSAPEMHGLPAANASGKTAPKAVVQGIKVNGYWKIDVRNPDGSLVKHVEFENALTANAISNYLPFALFGQPFTGVNYVITGVDAPAIGVNTGASQDEAAGDGAPWFPSLNGVVGPCGGSGCVMFVTNSATAYNCALYEKQSPSVCNGGLSVSAGTAGTTLSGSFTATSSNSITSVSSYITYCYSGTSPDPYENICPVPSGTTLGAAGAYALTLDFTSYTLPTPIPVTATQSVNVSVAISFSSPAGSSSNSIVSPTSYVPMTAKPASATSKP
jgi:hypothetical protein